MINRKEIYSSRVFCARHGPSPKLYAFFTTKTLKRTAETQRYFYMYPEYLKSVHRIALEAQIKKTATQRLATIKSSLRWDFGPLL